MRVLWMLAGLSVLLGGCAVSNLREQQVTLPALYCYKTLGQVDCHDAPPPGDAHRLVGFFGPPPEEKGSFGM